LFGFTTTTSNCKKIQNKKFLFQKYVLLILKLKFKFKLNPY
jgi:hypothetical protein